MKSLLKKHRELISYIFFGGLTTAVSILTHYAALYLGATTALATSVSWVLAVSFAFFVNKIFVFRSKSEKISSWFGQALAFFGARLLTYFLELGFLLVTVEVLLQNEYIMKLIAQVFVLIGNYLISKFIVFRKKPPV